MLAWGTGRSPGHSGAPKHAVAASVSGQTPKCRQPSMRSLAKYSSSSRSSGRPSWSTYKVRLAAGSGLMTLTLAMKRTSMAAASSQAPTIRGSTARVPHRGGSPALRAWAREVEPPNAFDHRDARYRLLVVGMAPDPAVPGHAAAVVSALED